jgi:aquaglyceroporin related protein
LCGNLTHLTAANDYGNFLTSDWAWGLGVMLGIYLAGGISGAHLNPAISIMLSIYRGFPWRRCGVYIIAQFLGAFAAAAVAYGLYHDAIMHYSGALIPRKTGLGFYTQPQPFISPATAFFNELVATGVLSCSILALGDDSNAPPGAGMAAFILGLLVTALCMVFGYNTGACLNPARDFGPRLVALAAGYGSSTFTAANCWWLWGAWVATITGAIVGGAAYDSFIFVGGESPINYPPKKARVLKRVGGGQTRLMADLEHKIQKHSD